MTFVDDVRRGLDELRRRDPGCTVFGASTHRYQLHPCAAEHEISAVEQEFGFRCPEDYRTFLLELGNGGAGPLYGLFRFGEVDDGSGFASWRSWKLRPGEPFPHTSAWNGEGLDDGRPCEDDFETEEAYDDALDEWEDSEAAEQAQDAYWDALGTNRGALPICHHGCALRDWLIVTGPEAGHVWHDASADQAGIAPVTRPGSSRITFADWYLDWIATALDSLSNAE